MTGTELLALSTPDRRAEAALIFERALGKGFVRALNDPLNHRSVKSGEYEIIATNLVGQSMGEGVAFAATREHIVLRKNVAKNALYLLGFMPDGRVGVCGIKLT